MTIKKMYNGLKAKANFLLFAVWAMLCLSFATSFSFIGTYETKSNFIAIDNFGSFYTAADNQLAKFSADGTYLYPYEEFKYGKIGMVDVTNPMKILVFCPDFMTVITLDKYLSPLTTYNFFELGYQNISAVAMSNDGLLWFYDNTDFKLKKIDETGAIKLQSQPLNTAMDAVPNPDFMLEKDNVVYLNDPAIGIMVFDIFGNYNKTVPIKGLKKFQVFQDQIIYFENNRLNAYGLVTLDFKSIQLPDTTDVVMAAIQKSRMAILKKDRVDFYRY
jgi:hypothetical protein